MQIEKIIFGTKPEFNSQERMDILSDLLDHNICDVMFTKLNGSLRAMRCTTNSTIIESVIGVNDKTKNTKPVDPNKPLTLSVFLPREETWRSFRVDNVLSIEVIDS